MDQSDLIDTLNDLVENCKDGEFGFRSTADHTKTQSLQQLLQARADECQSAAKELQTLILQLGGKPADSGTIAGALHRGWVATKGTLAGYSDLNMLEEAERGEDTALARYRAALKEELPAEVRAILQRQYEGASRNHVQVRSLRDQERARDAA